MIGLRLVVGALRHLNVQLLQLPLHHLQVLERHRCLLTHGAAVIERHLLWQVADSDLPGVGYIPLCRLLQSSHDLQQCRLAGAVLAHERHPFILVEYERDLVEECKSAKFNGEIFN